MIEWKNVAPTMWRGGGREGVREGRMEVGIWRKEVRGVRLSK